MTVLEMKVLIQMRFVFILQVLVLITMVTVLASRMATAMIQVQMYTLGLKNFAMELTIIAMVR
jgi:hypothetical protein